MNWLQFISEMVGHLAWPLVVLIVVFAIRKHLGSLAERILELSFGGATVKFDKLLSKGAEIINQAPDLKPSIGDTEPEPSLFEPHEDIKAGNIAGNAIINIFHAYRMTEKLIAEAAETLGVKTRDPTTVLRMLHKRGLVSSEAVNLHTTLREARNAAAHGAMFTLSDTEAGEFIRQALYLNLAIKQASKQLQQERKDRKPPKEGA